MPSIAVPAFFFVCSAFSSFFSAFESPEVFPMPVPSLLGELLAVGADDTGAESGEGKGWYSGTGGCSRCFGGGASGCVGCGDGPSLTVLELPPRPPLGSAGLAGW